MTYWIASSVNSKFGEIAAIIEDEIERDQPNRELIGYLNTLKQ